MKALQTLFSPFSIRYKLDDLKFFCMNDADILLTGETKLDFSFPDANNMLTSDKSHLLTTQFDKTKKSNGYTIYHVWWYL